MCTLVSLDLLLPSPQADYMKIIMIFISRTVLVLAVCMIMACSDSHRKMQKAYTIAYDVSPRSYL